MMIMTETANTLPTGVRNFTYRINELVEEVGRLRTCASVYRTSVSYDSRLTPHCAASQFPPTVLANHPTVRSNYVSLLEFGGVNEHLIVRVCVDCVWPEPKLQKCFARLGLDDIADIVHISFSAQYFYCVGWDFKPQPILVPTNLFLSRSGVSTSAHYQGVCRWNHSYANLRRCPLEN